MSSAAATPKKVSFDSDDIKKTVFQMAIPLILAQFVSVLYNVVDRLYISYIPNNAFDAMTGLGICLPLITTVTAFSALFSTGGAPLSTMERGKGHYDTAAYIMGNSFCLLIAFGFIITAVILLFTEPILVLLGASDNTLPFATEYITFYSIGMVFEMITLGMNPYINAQGYGKIGMLTVILGAVTNIVLDPVFIFVFEMGVKGAAIATVISQFLSAAWVLRFLFGPNNILKFNLSTMKLQRFWVGKILKLGIAGFVFQFTNSIISSVSNITLRSYGGDIYIGIFTICQSINSILFTPTHGFLSGANPYVSFNFGAGRFDRVKACRKLMTKFTLLYCTFIWIIILCFPVFLLRLFNCSPEVIDVGTKLLRLRFMCAPFQVLQMVGQCIFVDLGKSGCATFFSINRKIILLLPLTVFLPCLFGLGAAGVFIADPISEVLGGIFCYSTMLMITKPMLAEKSS